MLKWDPKNKKYSAEETPEFGRDTSKLLQRNVSRGKESHERAELKFLTHF